MNIPPASTANRKPAVAVTPPPLPVSAVPQVQPEHVRIRAHQIYQSRMSKGLPGTSLTDWLQAERELKDAALRGAGGADNEAANQARGERLLASGE